MRGSDALLDVDNTTGFGPETITVNRKHDGERYVYAVHNYSDGADLKSDRLSKSGAKVRFKGRPAPKRGGCARRSL